MTGAMYAAIAGLKTHMSKMNVIGNNIANVNTNGYKSQRTIFKDAMYTMYSSGSDGTTTTAGRNPSQVGYGSQVSSIDLNMATGSYAPGISTDCMIYGDGFFMVGDKDVKIDPLDPDSTKKLSLTRVGDFSFKADGYLSDGNGNAVYGFMATGKIFAAMRRMGFNRVFDTTTGADMTVVEEGNEFIERLGKGEKLPLFTSCCPAWIRYAESKHPELLENISSCRSPMQMFGSVIKEHYENDPDLKGSYTGISSIHTTAHFTRATLEGVAMSLKDCLNTLRELGVDMKRVRIIGGGAKGMLWRQIVADVLGIEMQKVKVDDSSFGTAMLTAVGIGWFESFAEAAEKCVQIDSVSKPNPENQAVYEKLFVKYKKIHDALAPIYQE